MKLTNVSLQNFGSYEHLEFDYSQAGLCLLSGTTGAGKSTLADAPIWILFGTTAKDGNSDEVLSWGNVARTVGNAAIVLSPQNIITITRIRGKQSENDLYFEDNNNGIKIRGKDLTDTQRLLNEKLGVSYETYVSATYFHEFSPTGSFFTAPAQKRRAVFEKIANLDFPMKLADAAAERRKISKKELEKLDNGILRVSSELKQMKRTLADCEERKAAHDKKQESLVSALEKKFANFAEEKEAKRKNLEEQLESIPVTKPHWTEIESLEFRFNALPDSGVCGECGQLKAQTEKSFLKECLSDLLHKQESWGNKELERKNIGSLLSKLDKEPNLYGEQLRAEKAKPNPFSSQIIRVLRDIGVAEKDLDTKTSLKKEIEAAISSLSHLHDLSFELRGKLLLDAVADIENKTNRFLEKYFDSEIRVAFTLEGADSLSVSIQKSGYDCVYKQLSRGQRALLRLCFSVSVMEAASNKSGTHFNALFFDEVLDGLAVELKVKAYSLFEELARSHESVFLIDHAEEFKNMFDNRYNVEMVEDKSEVSRA